MKHLILMFSHLDTGGLQTAMIRMAQWCKLNAVDCLLVFETCDEQMLHECKRSSIKFLKSFKHNQVVEAVSALLRSDNDEIIAITFELPEFLLFERIRYAYFRNKKIQHFIYNVWVGSMIYGQNKCGLAGKAIKSLNKAVFLKMHTAGQLYFMDNDTQSVPYELFGLKTEQSSAEIIPLPMFISEHAEISPVRDNGRVILTVSRSVFPYKGYMLGLVSDFPRLKATFPDLRLRIVSFGRDFDQLEDAISACPEFARTAIELIGQSTEEEIREYLKSAWLYIGMGTTVLDAADAGVPAIVACHSTNEDLCVGFFSDNPWEIGRAKKGIPAFQKICSAAKLSDDEYKQLSLKTRYAYSEIYDINKIMPQILNAHESSANNRTGILYFVGYLVFYKLRGLIRKVSQLHKQ